MGTIWLPPIPPATDSFELKDVSSVVIVGANGSGKSRLGAWIDGLIGKEIVVHRISAQRALIINPYISAMSMEQASRRLLIGTDNPQHKYSQKMDLRWEGNPISHLLNDFDVALAWLFAEHARTGIDFRNQCRSIPDRVPPLGESKLETALRIWTSIMPQRELLAEDNKISARVGDSDPYAGKEMSDGERVALYLISQCLSAPNNSIIVIDEPELHLHQAIQARLWDEIEAARPDCVFVFITHDLAFAASRASARKFWIRSFDGKHWDWQQVEPSDQFPESLVLQILGSRRPILFVEGDVSSFDTAIYRTLFPERLVIPRSSCEAVVNSTASLRTLTQLHHTDAYGIIDRDHRSDAEVTSYTNKGIFSPNVAEVENLFLIPPVIQFISRHLKRDRKTDFATVQDFLFAELAKELDVQINDRATFQIQQQLNSYGGQPDKQGEASEFAISVNTYLAGIDPLTIYSDSEALFKAIVQNRNYSSLLKHYNRKSLASRISNLLGLSKDEYPKLVLRLIQTSEGKSLRRALRSCFPGFSCS
jgi:energy-coupling factor transporter ATP-binding protein EcfA2